MAGGRPTKYDREQLLIARGAYAMGATDIQVAQLLGVAVSTVYLWKAEHEEFSEAGKVAKEIADDIVERSLYEKARGYSHPDLDIRVVEGRVVKTPIIKHYPPSDTAMIFWLKNRRRNDWRDRIDHNLTGDLGKMTDDEVEAKFEALMAKREGKSE